MGADHEGELERTLRDAVGSGDFTAFGELLEPDAVLDTSNESGRERIAGAEAILAHLGRIGPGDVQGWDAREWPSGLAASFEWRGPAGTDRRRWYVRSEAGRITGVWSYAARPGGDEAARVPEAVLRAVGEGARRAPLDHSGNSGAALERILLPDGTALIAKRVGPGGDWLARVTGDRGRTAMLWEEGAFARLPAELDHGIETVVPDGEAWWVLMRDLSASFLGDERRLSRAESRRILGLAAAIHAEFAGAPPAGAGTLTSRLRMSSLPIAESERRGADLIPKQLEAAWDAFAEAVPADVGDEILTAVSDPSALAAALEAEGTTTLLHGDLRDDNLGLTRDAVVLLDWDLATAGPATVDFAWYLCHDAWRIDAGHDEVEADYLEVEETIPSERSHELGMLTGLVQYGWIFGHSLLVHPDPAEHEWARSELDWWVPRTRRALEAAGGMPR